MISVENQQQQQLRQGLLRRNSASSHNSSSGSLRSLSVPPPGAVVINAKDCNDVGSKRWHQKASSVASCAWRRKSVRFLLLTIAVWVLWDDLADLPLPEALGGSGWGGEDRESTTPAASPFPNDDDEVVRGIRGRTGVRTTDEYMPSDVASLLVRGGVPKGPPPSPEHPEEPN